MNDRYLYRAKRTDNGEWVEGTLFDGKEYCIIGQNIKFSPYVSLECKIIGFEADRETICQCTAKPDKNKKLIFENDLVEINGTVYQCFWDDANFEWGFKNNSEDFGIAYVSSDDIRIAGNIFDNQELLEVGE